MDRKKRREFNMNVIIYGRQASMDDDKKELNAQMEKLTNYCIDKKFAISKTIFEYRSGSSISPTLKAAINDSINIDALVVTDISRIARNFIECTDFVQDMRKKKIRIIYTEQKRPLTISGICDDYGLTTEEEFVASQIVRHLEKEDIVTVKTAISNPNESEEFLLHALRGSIKDIENDITDSDTDEKKYIKREYIRTLKCFLDEPQKLKDINKCIREYFELKK